MNRKRNNQGQFIAEDNFRGHLSCIWSVLPAILLLVFLWFFYDMSERVKETLIKAACGKEMTCCQFNQSS